ncbi:MAG TPA: hypothetical protein VLD67_20585 [Vicinamibacterales bacterium]|nr:hypothetical protein [Vicinamibacterales bacterium]
MARLLLAAALVAGMAPTATAADPLAEARRLYNLGNYEAAELMAREALMTPVVEGARVVLGRIQLERYRRSAEPADLAAARESLRAVDAHALDGRERVELIIGLAESLYLEDRFRASADLFESVLERAAILGASARERVLDWWATAIDRHAQRFPPEERVGWYDGIQSRMRLELAGNPGSTAAGYWLAASARASGRPDEAWHFALAGWLRAALAEDRGAALRADLDRLVVQAIIPERAARFPPGVDIRQVEVTMLGEWDAFKAAWSR